MTQSKDAAACPEATQAERSAPLFVADHPALDFLNSHATPGGRSFEWLGDGAQLLGWMEQAGLLPAAAAPRLRAAPGSGAALDEVAKGARALREWLRGFVLRHAGRPLPPEAAAELGPLNLLLAENAGAARVEPAADGHFQLVRPRRWSGPEELLQPLAEAIADLVCTADFRLIRQCDGDDCSLVFLDRTKAHARRWCSMAACGNRAKAAAHRARVAGRPAG